MISWDQFLYVQYQHAHLTALPSHHPYIPPLFQLYHRVGVLGELCQQVQYDIVNEIENQLPLRPFSYEWEMLNHERKYLGLTKIEKVLPWLFIVMYVIAILWPLLKWMIPLICACQGGNP